MIELNELQEKIALKVLEEICPNEELFFSHYLRAAEKGENQLLEKSNETFKGEHFDLDGVYEMIGIGATILVYETVKLVYDIIKDNLKEKVKPVFEKVFEKFLTGKAEKIKLTEVQKKRIKERIVKEIIELALKGEEDEGEPKKQLDVQ